MFDLPPPIESAPQDPPAIVQPMDLAMLAPFEIKIGKDPEPRTLMVGPSARYKSINAAVKASHRGDRIEIAEGTYPDTFITVNHPLTLVGLGEGATLRSNRMIPNGKAYIIARADLTLENLIFKDAKVRDHNGAGIRYRKGNLSISHCVFENNENGILGGGNNSGSITIHTSRFINNGFGDGYTHGVYVGRIPSFEIQNSYFEGTRAGHHIKTRAFRNVIVNNFLDDAEVSSSYSIDIPNAGNGIVAGNVMIQGSNPDNPAFINFAYKPEHDVRQLDVVNNLFVNHANRGIAVQNFDIKPVKITENGFYNVQRIAKGSADETDNKTLTAVSDKETLIQEWVARIQ